MAPQWVRILLLDPFGNGARGSASGSEPKGSEFEAWSSSQFVDVPRVAIGRSAKPRTRVQFSPSTPKTDLVIQLDRSAPSKRWDGGSSPPEIAIFRVAARLAEGTSAGGGAELIGPADERWRISKSAACVFDSRPDRQFTERTSWGGQRHPAKASAPSGVGIVSRSLRQNCGNRIRVLPHASNVMIGFRVSVPAPISDVRITAVRSPFKRDSAGSAPARRATRFLWRGLWSHKPDRAARNRHSRPR
jgi:hypothetical protein